MGAPTAYYVDPAIAGNSGTGTIGDPYGDLQYALNTITRDATNGDIIHIKAGTAEILAASLTLTTYGTPSEGAPLVLRGYTSAARDGGIGEIDCGGNTMWSVNTYTSLYFVDLEIHTFGNNNGITVAGGAGVATFYHCDVHKGTSTPSGKSLIVGYGGRTKVINCYIHDAGTTGIGVNQAGLVYGSYIYNCPTGITNVFTAANNIIVDCATGILLADYNTAINNSIYSSTANTGIGISNSSGAGDGVIFNNIIEGYSGAGGKAISGVGDLVLLGYNAFYNNTTANSMSDLYIDLTASDATLTASPFTNAAGGDFSLNAAVAGAIETAWPGAWYGPASTTNKQDMGAVQKGAGVGSTDTLEVRAGIG